MWLSFVAERSNTSVQLLLTAAIYCTTTAVLSWCGNSFLDGWPACICVWLLHASGVRYSTDC
jgi:hypothetical protein